MRVSILCALQVPRPWDDGADRRAMRAALEQAALADRLGYHGLWALGRHFHEEHAHASAPDVLLAACAERTQRLRLGLAGVPADPAVQHPARLAEAVATLDVLSGGRVELATAALAGGAELGGFGRRRATAPAASEQGLALVARMLAERPFAGTGEGAPLAIAPREVVPRPLQRPHPPLWLAGARRETARLAAERGLGALLLSFVEPDEAAALVDEHRATLASDRCVPAGLALNPRVAVALPMMVHADEAEAIERGIDGAHFHAYATGHYDAFGDHRPGRTSLWDEFVARRDDVGLARSAIAADGAPLSVRVLAGGLASLRGAIGTPAQVADLVRRYAEAGVDELVLCVQTGRTRHEHVCEALELFASEVLPALGGDGGAAELPGGEPPAEVVRRALARRPRVPTVVPDHAFSAGDEGDDAPATAGTGAAHGGTTEAVAGAPAAPSRPAASPADARRQLAAIPRRARPRSWARRAQALRAAVETRGEEAFRRFVAASDDARIERTIGSGPGLRVLFTAMERRFDPERAGDFAGDIQYDLRVAGEVRSWTVTVAEGGASARPESSSEPRLTLVLTVADLARVAAGSLDPVAAVLTGRLELRGDFTIALRLGEMFGLGGAG